MQKKDEKCSSGYFCGYAKGDVTIKISDLGYYWAEHVDNTVMYVPYYIPYDPWSLDSMIKAISLQVVSMLASAFQNYKEIVDKVGVAGVAVFLKSLIKGAKNVGIRYIFTFIIGFGLGDIISDFFRGWSNGNPGVKYEVVRNTTFYLDLIHTREYKYKIKGKIRYICCESIECTNGSFPVGSGDPSKSFKSSSIKRRVKAKYQDGLYKYFYLYPKRRMKLRVPPGGGY